MFTTLLLASFAAFGAENPYQVGAGDTLNLSVFGEAELSGDFQIPAACVIEVQLLGVITACDRTTAEIGEEIRLKLETDYIVSPNVLVTVTDYGSQVVEIKGDIKTPGVLALTGPTTLSEAISMSGGPSSSSVMYAEVVTHGQSRSVYLPNLQKEPVWLQTGDTVFLHPPVHVFVHGEVKTQGQVDFVEGLTVTRALAIAGGANEYANLRSAHIVRHDGEKVRVNIRRINDGLDADVVLGPHDKLVIGRSVF